MAGRSLSVMSRFAARGAAPIAGSALRQRPRNGGTRRHYRRPVPALGSRRICVDVRCGWNGDGLAEDRGWGEPEPSICSLARRDPGLARSTQIDQYVLVTIDDDRLPGGKLQGPLPGRRRTLGNVMALAGCVGGAAAVIGSILPWMMRGRVGDTSAVSVSGIQGGALGRWTIIIGVGLVLGGLFAAMLEIPGRAGLVAVPSVVGLFVCLAGWNKSVDIGGGNIESGSPGVGLILTALAFAAALATCIVLMALDKRAPAAVVDGVDEP
jgi:hypothetical protein